MLCSVSVFLSVKNLTFNIVPGSGLVVGNGRFVVPVLLVGVTIEVLGPVVIEGSVVPL